MAKAPRNLILFEDEAALSLEPISLTRPVWELRCGLRSLAQKISDSFFGVENGYLPRAHLAKAFGKEFAGFDKNSDNNLWVNGAMLPGDAFSSVANLEKGQAWARHDRIIAFRGRRPAGWNSGVPLKLEGYHIAEAPPEVGKLICYPWDLVHALNPELVSEARRLRELGQILSDPHGSAVLICPAEIYIGHGCQVGPNVVLDASSGPLVLDDEAVIGANAVIEGPSYIGPRAQIKPLTHVRGSSIGEDSRAGGEISVSILHGFTNKQHGGFLGHSYLGEWCNLGSGTETSNLKNNYSSVKVQVGEKLVDSGELFVGLTMGDHSKTAIGTVFNTGTVVGVGCNIFGANFPPRFVPSFQWGGAEKLTRYPFNKTIEVAQAVMSRRGKKLADEELAILRWVFEQRSETRQVSKD